MHLINIYTLKYGKCHCYLLFTHQIGLLWQFLHQWGPYSWSRLGPHNPSGRPWLEIWRTNQMPKTFEQHSISIGKQSRKMKRKTNQKKSRVHYLISGIAQIWRGTETTVETDVSMCRKFIHNNETRSICYQKENNCIFSSKLSIVDKLFFFNHLIFTDFVSFVSGGELWSNFHLNTTLHKLTNSQLGNAGEQYNNLSILLLTYSYKIF